MPSPQAAPAPPLRRAPIPATRDPFINALLTPLPPRADGRERFWHSTWNSVSGALGVVVSEDGEHRIYRTGDPRYAGFYSAAPAGPADPEGMWLLGWLHQALHLDLKTGELEEYDTTAPQAITFSGMPLDEPSGKMLAVTFAPPQTLAVSFDTRQRRAVRVQAAPTRGHYMRRSLPNGDGTWSIVLHVPGEHLLIWDPRTDALQEVIIAAASDTEANGTTYHLLQDTHHGVYFPHRGWYNPLARRLTGEGPRPREEMTWFGNLGDSAVGVNIHGATAMLGLWCFASGAVQPLAQIPDCHITSLGLTGSGKVIAVNLYGDFYRLDARSGSLELSRRLPTEAIGGVHSMCRVDRDRVLGAPYITQRFWETNLRTREAADYGRVAPGFGEITRMQKAGARLYLAAYNGGELMEYDPRLPARFPENPRVVADPPGAMRPVGICTDGRHVFYACSNRHGQLGSTLTRYDTRTGHARDVRNPLPHHQIHSLVYDKEKHRLLAGTTFHADAQGCPPASDTCYFAAIDAETLQPTQTWPAPAGTVGAYVIGPLGRGQWLGHLHGAFPLDITNATVVFNPAGEAAPAAAELRALPPGTREVHYSGRVGRFILMFEQRLELWDMRRLLPLNVLYRGRRHIQKIAVDSHTVLIALPREIVELPLSS